MSLTFSVPGFTKSVILTKLDWQDEIPWMAGKKGRINVLLEAVWMYVYIYLLTVYVWILYFYINFNSDSYYKDIWVINHKQLESTACLEGDPCRIQRFHKLASSQCQGPWVLRVPRVDSRPWHCEDDKLDDCSRTAFFPTFKRAFRYLKLTLATALW